MLIRALASSAQAELAQDKSELALPGAAAPA